MIGKIWKKVGLIILMIACLFNIVSKLVQRTTIKEHLTQSVEHIVNQENNK